MVCLAGEVEHRARRPGGRCGRGRRRRRPRRCLPGRRRCRWMIVVEPVKSAVGELEALELVALDSIGRSGSLVAGHGGGHYRPLHPGLAECVTIAPIARRSPDRPTRGERIAESLGADAGAAQASTRPSPGSCPSKPEGLGRRAACRTARRCQSPDRGPPTGPGRRGPQAHRAERPARTSGDGPPRSAGASNAAWESRRHPGSTLPQTRVEDTVLDLVAEARTTDEVVRWVLRACQRRLTTAGRLRVAAARRQRLRHRALVQQLVSESSVGVASALQRRYRRDVERGTACHAAIAVRPRAVRRTPALLRLPLSPMADAGRAGRAGVPPGRPLLGGPSAGQRRGAPRRRRAALRLARGRG